MIEVHAEFPQREVIQANAVVDNEEKTVSEVIISAKPEITGVTASVDNETGTPYVDVTETGTGTDFSFNLAFHNLKGDKGDTGEKGQTGNGIVSITKTATVGLEDDYTINFTNGTQTVYTVTNGADGQDGTDGTDGQDGFSPIATVEPIQDGAKITITDKDGTTTANVYNGTDGQNGVDGQAATITVGSTTTGQAGTSASVVNSGTSSAAILDFTIPKGDKGDTGNTGATGADGFSPTATVTQSGGITTISITDKDGTTTESIDLSSYATQTDLTNGLATKQDTLIAGTDLEIIPAGLPILPEGFTQIEYIEGTGTQYIDTGFYGTQNSGAYIRFALTDLTSEGSARVFGTRNGSGGTGAFAFISSFDGTTSANDYFFVAANGSNTSGRVYSINTEWNEVSCNVENDKKSYFNNNLLFTGNSTAFTSNAQASIFRTYNRTSYGLPATAKISVVRIYENAILVHNYIPCRRDSDDELGMYDLVTDTFLTNSGTGTFIAGADVLYPPKDLINFTNESGYIKGINSTDVTTALGYTPYDSSNPDGYTTNVGTVTSVNNELPDSNGNVSLTIPTVNNGVLTITQNGTSKGTFSANQSTNDTIALTDTTYNNFTGADGTNAGSSGLVPAPSATDNDKYLKGDGTWTSVSGGSSTDVQINGTSITSQGVANIVTNTAYDASNNKIATMSDLPSGGANTDLSNLTATGEAHFQEPLVSGTNIKTINNTSLLGSGNIDTSEIFIATYGTTTFQQVSDAFNANKAVFCKRDDTYKTFAVLKDYGTTYFTFFGCQPDGSVRFMVNSSNTWTSNTYTYLTSSSTQVASSRFDGQWVAKYLDVASNTAINSYTHSLSTYLPNDSQAYEIFVRMGCNTLSSSSGGSCIFTVGTVTSPETNYTSGFNASLKVTTNSTQARSAIILPIASNVRNFYSQISGHKMDGTFIALCGYRRIGTNA